MKKINSLLFAILIASASFAQVAINNNGNNPHSSAMLDINTPNKGLLIPRVYLQSTSDGLTIPSPAVSLMVYNTNGTLPRGAGYYYNSGTQAAPNWQAVMDIILPYYEGTNASGTAFCIDNYHNLNSTSAAIRGYGGGTGRGVEGIAESGIGVMAKSTSGNALEVDGKMKISGNGQAPQQGKVLTSDASGNATWQGAVAFAATGVRFGSHTIANATPTKIKFHSQTYDLGNDYNDADAAVHSTFIAPVDGIYHFDGQIQWDNNSASGSDFCNLTLQSKLNGVTTAFSHIISAFDGETYMHQRVSIDVKLTAGTEVWLSVNQNTGGSLNLVYNNYATYFNGHLIVKL